VQVKNLDLNDRTLTLRNEQLDRFVRENFDENCVFDRLSSKILSQLGQTFYSYSKHQILKDELLQNQQKINSLLEQQQILVNYYQENFYHKLKAHSQQDRQIKQIISTLDRSGSFLLPSHNNINNNSSKISHRQAPTEMHRYSFERSLSSLNSSSKYGKITISINPNQSYEKLSNHFNSSSSNFNSSSNQ
jgi:hypothetical protein